MISGEELWRWQKQAKLSAIASEISPLEVDWLLQEIAGFDRLTLRLETYKTQTQLNVSFSLPDLDALWQQRLQTRVPIQYLAGRTPWRKFRLKVGPGVLIPRPETEDLIEIALKAAQTPAQRQGHWVDLGTGSGAIAIGLADAFPDANIHAVDRSSEALAIAQENARTLGFDRIQFYQGSWFAPLSALRGKLAAVVSNPPYIPSAIVTQLQPEVVNHEPHLALDGGTDGLDCIRHLVVTAPDYLCSNGIWLIEMMAGQADSVLELLRDCGEYHSMQVFRDFTGIERFVLAYRS
ncbi:peptide chain release factor N(5)-glutamine methyltransferase [Desertifilum sp. FACHB-1129]|uniref:Release factor glutamine methyltransferase n=1 Tax=Desertifilum tharense IPPAS B-1220 TaxID=1781255 RepID=A0A1E5QEM3_9CYAN|nr:peptide chain release factor N(5)-glutamine methyltransferase [Desertifilum tharense]MBD2313108.1 peptide chain release factor N(5)-glutamine methyltransferase [Desertifilum sp. FACHB-1129]MBD2324086.1 peptide chain release factor N(5)-glutamine methyltransferase [Desertifilum sp. FACHB-866]MBD2334021.1 peptide chain release factor N(5)-glutamine methyltransferase [Desertifilum sp. FACHB-868]MDA0212661.1 peptide chain release factor N(5)-glutamine methyltransferase [Cyanobacteria bacterium F